MSGLETATVVALAIWATVAAVRRALIAWRPTWPRAWTRAGRVALPLAPLLLGVGAAFALYGPSAWSLLIGGAWGAGASQGRTILRRIVGTVQEARL
jgi:hypothetical protein